MPQNDASPRLLEPALPGAWITVHRRIWQMDFLNAYELARFSHDRGAAYFNETDIIQLWQLGILKADLIISPRKLRLVGLTYRGIDFNGFQMYSDERQPPRRKGGWANARKPLKHLQKGIELLFHPFRFYVLYHIGHVLDLRVSSMQMLLQENFPRLLKISLTMFNNSTRSDTFITNINTWNDIASLVILTEPCFYERIFHTLKVSLSAISSVDDWKKQIQQEIDEYWEGNVQKLFERIGVNRLEEIRQELCVVTQMLDRNRWIHTLLCLGTSKLRLELEGNLGGALLLRTMAEMLRRATEKAFDEGDTEYGALKSFFGMMGIPVTNLHGLIKEGKSKTGKPFGATFFRDNLADDISEQRYSIVVIDKDVEDNVRVLRSAARNNQTTKDEGIFGSFFLSDPDFEFDNFEVEELEEVLWKLAEEENPTSEDRKLLHSCVIKATRSKEFEVGVSRASLSLPQLIGLVKSEKWGEELMRYAWEHPEHPFKQNQERQIVEIVKLALYWEKTIDLEPYEIARKTYTVDPQTGNFVKRPSK